MTATEVLCQARQLGAHFTMSGKDPVKVSSALPLPGSLMADLKIHKAEIVTLLDEEPDYSLTACTCGESTGRTGSNRCGVCALPLICPHCSGCRGCRRAMGRQ
jgi:hypothetical protein